MGLGHRGERRDAPLGGDTHSLKAPTDIQCQWRYDLASDGPDFIFHPQFNAIGTNIKLSEKYYIFELFVFFNKYTLLILIDILLITGYILIPSLTGD